MIEARVLIGRDVGWPAGLARLPDDRRGPAAAPRPERILIVEDEYVVALDMEDTLRQAGFEVTGIARTAEEAVRLAEAGRPALVVMDIMLAGERDGIEAATEIFERFGIRSVFASALRDPASMARASRANSLGWVSKPYTPASLVAAVRSALAAGCDRH